MKIKTLLILMLTICYAKGQSLSLTPNLSPPTVVPKYTHSNLTNGSVFNSNFDLDFPTFQSNTNTPIVFSVNDGSALMILGNTGYFGLGATIPLERLDIKNGRIRFTGEKSAGNPSGLVFSDNSIPSPIFKINMVDDNVLGIRDYISTSNFLMNVNTGNVGIGISPATEALTVNGTIHNTQFENADNVSNQVIASINGDLLKGELNKIEITPWAYSRFSTKTNNNFTVFANLGYYSNTAGDALFSAPIHLPHNVKLKTIEAKLVDNSFNSYLKINVYGQTLGGGFTNVISFDSKPTPESTGVALINGIFNHTTDCNEYFYILTVSSLYKSDDTPTYWDGPNLKIGTITITYGY